MDAGPDGGSDGGAGAWPGGPVVLSVEPQAAACVWESLVRQEPAGIETGDTAMAGLNCGTPSSLAWPVLRAGLDAAVAISEAQGARAVRDLGALGVSAGPCGAASLAGVRAALTGEGATDRRATLAIGPTSTLVLLSTEGTAANPHGERQLDATDPTDATDTADTEGAAGTEVSAAPGLPQS
ncbi:pyridoxal-phosphate dependent enzyme [Streptomyces sp. 796.1]|uniref:pyridoxal-phosphate dependent enzyme n=1 Tax=Streptomyces sp. 796.1 TaxID=3163029 RepID=UPI0039C9EE07